MAQVTPPERRIDILATINEVVRRHDQELLNDLDYTGLVEHLGPLLRRLAATPKDRERDERINQAIAKDWPTFDRRYQIEFRSRLLQLSLRRLEELRAEMPTEARQLLEAYLAKHVPYAAYELEQEAIPATVQDLPIEDTSRQSFSLWNPLQELLRRIRGE